MSPEEKARIAAAARARHLSVGELVRTAVARFDAPIARRKDGRGKARGPTGQLGFWRVRDDDRGGEWWCSPEGDHFYIVRNAQDSPDEPPISGVSPGHNATVRAAKPEPPEAEKQKVGSSSLILQADEAAALERLAGVALKTLGRANLALDEAFEEIEATKAYFAAKRSAAETSS